MECEPLCAIAAVRVACCVVDVYETATRHDVDQLCLVTDPFPGKFHLYESLREAVFLYSHRRQLCSAPSPIRRSIPASQAPKERFPASKIHVRHRPRREQQSSKHHVQAKHIAEHSSSDRRHAISPTLRQPLRISVTCHE